MAEPRGIRNRNPGNIRISSAPWLGKIPEDQNTDGTFEQFTEDKYGIRALSIILRNYHKIHGLQTLREYISRWAPPGENDTSSYLTVVCAALNIDPDVHFDVADPILLSGLVGAIIEHENGYQPYERDVLNGGIGLA